MDNVMVTTIPLPSSAASYVGTSSLQGIRNPRLPLPILDKTHANENVWKRQLEG